MSSKFIMKRIIVIVFVLLIGSSFTYVSYGYFDSMSEQEQGGLIIGEWAETCTTISTPQEFFDFATATPSTSTDFYCLVNDLDFTGFTWEYIEAFDTNRFRGLFDGNGYAISNLKMTTSATTNILFSIFSTMEGATIQNVTIENFGVDLDIASFNAAQLESSIFASEVYGANNVFDNITVINSTVVANTTDGAGGLVTTVQGDADLSIRNIKVRGLTVANDERRAGGLISRILAGTNIIIIEDIDFEGNVGSRRSANNTTSHTGSISGTVQSVDFTLSRVIAEYTSIAIVDFTDGQLSITTGKNVGGFVGNNNSGSIMTINDGFFTGNLYTDRTAIGTVLGRRKADITLNNVFYSNVYFSDSYAVTTGNGVINGTMVNEQSMPDNIWWDGFAVNFYNANDLWTQDVNGRLELDRS